MEVKAPAVRVGVIGDFCLDVYWYADMTQSELSRETAHFPLPVKKEIMSPGGAGNVACNLMALGVKSVVALGLIGDDWRGVCLKNTLAQRGVDVSGLVTEQDRFTNTYIKPMRYGYGGTPTEDPRLDFEADALPCQRAEDALAAALINTCEQIDVLCVCDQMKFGCITPRIREQIIALGKQGKLIFVDSRDRIGLYENVIVKPNDLEASRACGTDDPAACVRALSQKTHRPALVTCGEKGCFVCENDTVTAVSAFSLPGEVDVCGAGDTFLSALAAFSSAGMAITDAAKLANAASCVTVHKVRTTGTATVREIKQVLQQK